MKLVHIGNNHFINPSHVICVSPNDDNTPSTPSILIEFVGNPKSQIVIRGVPIAEILAKLTMPEN